MYTPLGFRLIFAPPKPLLTPLSGAAALLIEIQQKAVPGLSADIYTAGNGVYIPFALCFNPSCFCKYPYQEGRLYQGIFYI